MADPSQLFSGFSLGGGGGGGILLKVLLIFFVSIVILGLLGLGLWLMIENKKYKYKIPLYKKVGNFTQRVGFYKAKDWKIGKAGDKLWRVRKIGKFISPAEMQNAPNEYAHFERSDGEWINIAMPDVDEKMKEFGVKYVHQDMRSNRIAISNILDKRFEKQSWWDKYGNIVTYVIFYLVVAIALVLIFHQWSKIVESTGLILDRIVQLEDRLNPNAVVPAIALFFTRFKKNRRKKWAFSKI